MTSNKSLLASPTDFEVFIIFGFWQRVPYGGRMLNSVLEPIARYLFVAGLPVKISSGAADKLPFRGAL
jgi:hypothetical protein